MNHCITLTLLCLLAACSNQWVGTREADYTLLRQVVRADSKGRFDLGIPIEDNQDALNLSVQFFDVNHGFFFRLYEPEGGAVFTADDWWEAPNQLSNAIFQQSNPTLNWPIRSTDQPLYAGEWKTSVYSDEPGGQALVELIIRNKKPVEQRKIRARLMYSQALEESDPLLLGLREAVDLWTTDLYTQSGLTVQSDYHPTNMPNTLPLPGNEAGLNWEGLTQQAEPMEIPILLITGTLPGGLKGVSGNIPGPAISSVFGAVVISLGEAAGPDGVLSPSERRLLSETLAHEVGHYLGLYHPMELPCTGPDCEEGTNISVWDSLPDTPDCTELDNCADLMAHNLMFPVTVCPDPTLPDGCIPQDSLTDAQKEVAMNHATFH